MVLLDNGFPDNALPGSVCENLGALGPQRDSAGRIWTIDTNYQIFVLAQDGGLIASMRARLPDGSDLEGPPFVIDADGRIYLADLSGTTDARLIIGQLEAPLWPPPGE